MKKDTLDQIIEEIDEALQSVNNMSYKSGPEESEYERGVKKGKTIAYNMAKTIIGKHRGV